MAKKTTVDTSGFQRKMEQVRQAEDQAQQHAFEFFRDITPIDRGNARRNTQRSGNKIQANYSYASVLDAGRGFRDGQMRGSTQAPRGMSKPTIAEYTKYLTALLRKIR